MTRHEFFSQLELLLADFSSQEKQQVITRYTKLFDDWKLSDTDPLPQDIKSPQEIVDNLKAFNSQKTFDNLQYWFLVGFVVLTLVIYVGFDWVMIENLNTVNSPLFSTSTLITLTIIGIVVVALIIWILFALLRRFKQFYDKK